MRVVDFHPCKRFFNAEVAFLFYRKNLFLLKHPFVLLKALFNSLISNNLK